MAPRAACRLEALGFSDVRVYRGGKSDWSAAGLPTEGAAIELRARDVMHPLATCSPSDLIADVREESVVVDAGGVVVGRVRAEQLDAEPEPGVRVEDVMTPGPSTVRADEPLRPLVERMVPGDVPSILVTDPDGVLLGKLERADAERELGARAAEAT
jgi:CBS domain-containing protein